MALSSRRGLKKVTKTVRGPKGSVKRTYWVKANPKAGGSMRQAGPDGEPGFLRRHAGKIMAGAALLGGAALGARHIQKHGLSKTGQQLQGLGHTAFSAAKSRITGFRQHTGGGLAAHLAHVGGEAALSHVGSRFGQVAGTAVGGFLGGAPGAALGGFFGGHAGNFLAGHYGGSHVQKLANWVGNRAQGSPQARASQYAQQHQLPGLAGGTSNPFMDRGHAHYQPQNHPAAHISGQHNHPHAPDQPYNNSGARAATAEETRAHRSALAQASQMDRDRAKNDRIKRNLERSGGRRTHWTPFGL